MVQYKCDMCRQEISNNVHIINDFPRVVRYWATNNHGVKLLSVDKYETAETHLCEECSRRLADAFAVVE